jgi:phosphoadenosine phosphosulfate reductase
MESLVNDGSLEVALEAEVADGGRRSSPLKELTAQLPALALEDRLALVARLVPGRKVFTTSLGLEDQAIAHAIFSQRLPIEVVTLDTGRLFPETYDLWAATEEHYAHRIKGLSPDAAEVEALIADQGINGFRYGVDLRMACCFVRMVVPLTRALGGAAAWITGLRGDQSLNRATMVFAQQDSAHRVLKVNPLLDWSRDDVVAYVKEHAIPYNPLHDQGFLSIGCAPCTRAVKPGEPERAGRWWWEDEAKKECGLHEPAAAEAV